MAVLRDHLEATLRSKIKDEDGAVSNYLPIYNDSTKITAAEVSAGVTPVNYAYPPGDVRRYGAKLDGVTDDTQALINATLATTGTGIPVVIPYGTLLVTPGTAQSGAATYNCACEMRSDTTYIGYNAATIKLADNYSTDASPKELAIFSTPSAIAHVSFYGITFDMNGANNKMSPGRLNNVVTTGASGTGATATLTFAAQPIAPPVGGIIVVSGVTPTGYNTGASGATITASTTTSVSYANTTVGAQTVAGQISGCYNSYNHAAIIANGPSGYINNCTVSECTLKNNAGVCFIVFQLVAAGTTPTLGKTWNITNNLFLNGGTDSRDHTSVYAFGENVICDGNTFWQDNPPHTVGLTGGATCYEVHGSNQRVVNNYFYNYTLGMYVAPNFTSETISTVVANNVFYCSDYGVLIWRQYESPSVLYAALNDILIDANSFYFSNYTYSGQPTYKAAVAFQGQIPSDQGAVNNVKISNNLAVNTGSTLLSNFVKWDSPTPATSQKCSNISITGNQVIGFTNGVQIITNSDNGQGLTEISRNQFIDLNPDLLGNLPTGIYVNASGNGVDMLIIDGNTFTESRGSPQFARGILLTSGTITNLYLGPQLYNGLTTANYTESGVTITNWLGPARDGISTITYSASMTPDWSAGTCHIITATNSTAFTINTPTRGKDGSVLQLMIRNASGGALGAVTWNANYGLSAWTQPANGFSRSIAFRKSGSLWIQISQTGVDVPN